MDITQKFYNNLASKYDKLFSDWNKDAREQGELLDKLFQDNGFEKGAKILDCACGIGTQAIGLALKGYSVTASDISEQEIKQAKKRAMENEVDINFSLADFRCLEKTFNNSFDIVIAMDNALPHMLTEKDLKKAVKSIWERVNKNGIFVASIRDYDQLLKNKPPYSPPYIHKTENGQRVSFQTWEWDKNHYKLIQYIIEDEKTLQVSKFECEYRAFERKELTDLLLANGCEKVNWLFPEQTGFYQPIVIAKK